MPDVEIRYLSSLRNFAVSQKHPWHKVSLWCRSVIHVNTAWDLNALAVGCFETFKACEFKLHLRERRPLRKKRAIVELNWNQNGAEVLLSQYKIKLSHKKYSVVWSLRQEKKMLQSQNDFTNRTVYFLSINKCKINKLIGTLEIKWTCHKLSILSTFLFSFYGLWRDFVQISWNVYQTLVAGASAYCIIWLAWDECDLLSDKRSSSRYIF